MGRGLTLIETLVVICVAIVLVSVSLPALAAGRRAARAAACLASARHSALEWTDGVERHRQRRTLGPGEYAPSLCPATRRWHDRLVTADQRLIRDWLDRAGAVVWDQAGLHGIPPHDGGYSVSRADGSARIQPALPAEPHSWR